jgi:hypothetical protein
MHQIWVVGFGACSPFARCMKHGRGALGLQAPRTSFPRSLRRCNPQPRGLRTGPSQWQNGAYVV